MNQMPGFLRFMACDYDDNGGMICVKRKILLNLLCIEEMDFQSKSLCLWLPPGHAPSIPVGSPFSYLFALQQLLVL